MGQWAHCTTVDINGDTLLYLPLWMSHRWYLHYEFFLLSDKVHHQDMSPTFMAVLYMASARSDGNKWKQNWKVRWFYDCYKLDTGGHRPKVMTLLLVFFKWMNKSGKLHWFKQLILAQMWHLLGWNESLHPHRPFADKVWHPWSRTKLSTYYPFDLSHIFIGSLI